MSYKLLPPRYEEKNWVQVQSKPVPRADPSFDAQGLWEEAYYQALEDRSIMDIASAYEAAIRSKILSRHEDGSGSLVREIASLDSLAREQLMTGLVNQDTVESNRSKTIVRISSVFENTNAIISPILSLYPPAAIVWAGVCLLTAPVISLNLHRNLTPADIFRSSTMARHSQTIAKGWSILSRNCRGIST
ncbi:hypothetical protein ASPZODRAFT_1558339 [Penicilliopsis zonata CBS 506.65]|uniref:NWD NACHT-NTPase N-terminal domain-containing protein n=1 Tax=Penicilliopsis zonata CBS 506.65 TaxID=1073090 RepID=A0A1L9SM78_9EURO|nr:hypothetical protein ASPZODRAFT_1558339 [Penicilliopsis zonata CBS 506.65]OJJ48298.1 hypothetical protein ASPZODRAFT_1558339 [Penicilliopsis zonata CBS 506.65]